MFPKKTGKGEPDVSREVTVFVATIGDEENFRDSMRHLERQHAGFLLDVVDHVAPMSAAFQEMLDRCATPYYIQVDEDMLLFPHAVETLFQRIACEPPTTALVCAPLWDCDMEESLHGVKIFRHEIVRQFPYENTFSCEKTQLNQLRDKGYGTCILPLDGAAQCLGEHGKHYTPRSIFVRWQRLMQKQRRNRNLPWVEHWPARLLNRYLATREPLHLFAFLGIVSGTVGELPAGGELDFRIPCEDFGRLACYFLPDPLTAIQDERVPIS
ncbi:MAG: hypothetical protein KIT09_07010 [Bryobacteraceae bacterium]|nr:hypothetical protein [Bryobacteraceae bacterium]